MRKHSAFTPSLYGRPYGRGFFVGAMLVVALAASAPAQAADVTITFRVAAGGHTGVVKECANVRVPQGSGGTTVMNAAVAQGCIRSYKATTSGGTFVTCIDPAALPAASEICQQGEGLVTFWAYYRNGVPQSVGVDTFNAQAGATITFAYTNHALCPLYPTCFV